MNSLLIFTALLTFAFEGDCYTKYGRSCKDIGCPSNQKCVMETDPCSYYQRQGECGQYPTCKKIQSGERTCANFVCPPSQVCQMDGGHPKCIADASKSGHVGYDTHSANSPVNNDSPSAPPANNGNIYPQIPHGETTPRPNVRPAYPGGSGYQGGQIGSGYPGQSGGYPSQSGGYPGQAGGYPQGGYQGYPQGGYQGYPQGGYNQGGYQQYPGGYQNNYNPYQYPQKSSGSSITDQITQGLKQIGLFYILVHYYLASTFHL
ncbi:uncharacterized protein LOC143189116 [Rhynchophorus ferrugineus]|uniref:uncharacterized protein LOC143189116 n=1 Tax=Rhynchophorus ferrugineus TaxID=354439 RepID=UPI003FCEA170